MPHKKIIFVIVEGPSDEDAIGTLLSRFYNGNEVHIHVVHGDITTQRCVNPHTIVTKIGNLVRQYAGRTFKQTDYSRINGEAPRIRTSIFPFINTPQSTRCAYEGGCFTVKRMPHFY